MGELAQKVKFPYSKANKTYTDVFLKEIRPIIILKSFCS